MWPRVRRKAGQNRKIVLNQMASSDVQKLSLWPDLKRRICYRTVSVAAKTREHRASVIRKRNFLSAGWVNLRVEKFRRDNMLQL